jgi:hypothetical protein
MEALWLPAVFGVLALVILAIVIRGAFRNARKLPKDQD